MKKVIVTLETQLLGDTLQQLTDRGRCADRDARPLKNEQSKSSD